MIIKEKLKQIINLFNESILEKDEIIKLSLLGLISGENIFLLGKPGIAKSLIAREICKLIDDGKYFEYLMNNFSTPEELFGPISLKKLNDDIYERKIDGYLPSSHVVFLDEIWKASPAIQNTLLTIINEKIYINGGQKVSVPLKLFISASNELPMSNEGLDALFDRFIIRVVVNNIENKDNFEKMVSSPNVDINVPLELKFSISELDSFKESINKITIPKNIFYFIHNFREELNKKMIDKDYYISDRRWKKIFWILKTLAFASNRMQIGILDLLIIPKLIWVNTSQIEIINSIFRDTFSNSVLNFFSPILNKLLLDIEKLYDEIKVKSKNIKFIKKMNNSIGETHNNIFYAEFLTVNKKEEKYFILPITIRQSAWSDSYEPYTNLNSNNIIYYYEKVNNEYIKKIYDSKYFLIEPSKTSYIFMGYKVNICQKDIITINEFDLNSLNQKFISIKNEFDSLPNIRNNVEREFNEFDSILLSNNLYEKEKLKNIVLLNINKIEKSLNDVYNQINEIFFYNKMIKENDK